MGPGRAGGHQDGGHPVGRRGWRLDRLDRPAGSAACGPPERGRRSRSCLLPQGRHRSRPSPTPTWCWAIVPADYFLGGEIALGPGLPRWPPSSASPIRWASPWKRPRTAIRTTVNSYMADQITEVATRRGHDVRDFALVAGGGAGPVHAAFIADLLHMPQVVIPPIAATYSAFGMFAMDVGRNYARSYITRATELDLERVNRAVRRAWRPRPSRASAPWASSLRTITFARTADLRYRGPVPRGRGERARRDARRGGHRRRASTASIARHEQLYTFDMPWQRCRAAHLPAAGHDTPGHPSRCAGSSPVEPTRRVPSSDGASVWFDGRRRWTRPIYDGALLRAGNEFHGPAHHRGD